MFTKFLEGMGRACDIFSFGSKKRLESLLYFQMQNGLIMDQLHILQDLQRVDERVKDGENGNVLGVSMTKFYVKDAVNSLTKPLVVPIVGIQEHTSNHDILHHS